LLVRSAILDDIPAMMTLERHAVTAAHWSRDQYEQLFARSTPKRYMLVIEEAAHLQGFLVARSAGKEWEIENIAVAGPARRRGLGTRFLGEFLDQVRAQGAEAVLLEVRESNQAARSLYEKWAFVESGRRKRYYHDPEEDAVVYRLSLP
jgi:ribosomal-protein-alanine N-acetyltransferase